MSLLGGAVGGVEREAHHRAGSRDWCGWYLGSTPRYVVPVVVCTAEEYILLNDYEWHYTLLKLSWLVAYVESNFRVPGSLLIHWRVPSVTPNNLMSNHTSVYRYVTHRCSHQRHCTHPAAATAAQCQCQFHSFSVVKHPEYFLYVLTAPECVLCGASSINKI